MFTELPLADRKALELGKVELFSLRSETGVIQAQETDALKNAQRARQGTLMRVEHGQEIVYYEVFAKGRIVKRTDLPEVIELSGVIGRKSIPSPRGPIDVPIVRGSSMPFDFDAYASGSDPRPNVMSSAVIVESLGDEFAGRALPGNHTMQTYVPDTYGSSKVASIVRRIVQDNFYDPAEAMLQRARAPLPLEARREERAREHEFLLGFVPFVGAYQAFKQGDIGKGVGSLALDAFGLAIGAGGQARGLIRSARALAPNPVARLVARLKPSAGAWGSVKPTASFSDRAFDFIKQAGLFTSAALNPLDGYPQLLSAATKGLVKVPALLAGAGAKWGKTAPHLVTAQEKLRTYLLVAAGQVDAKGTPVASSTSTRPERNQEAGVPAVQYKGHWSAIDPRSGRSFSTPLNGFLTTA
ncbi:hypothetical protein AO262_07015 [Pseudomonas fluorescens ABAC62]|nr:hypothetical protein AO262_07015 [Pseudomonas fluorescens ABAC62]